MGLWESVKEFQYSSEYDQEYAEKVAEQMRQDITGKELRRKSVGNKSPLHHVDEDENFVYFLSGFDLDVDDNDEGFQSNFIITDKRLNIRAHSITGKTSEYVVYYDDIIGVSIQKRVTSQIRIQTAGHSFKISAAGSKSELTKEVMEYIRKRAKNGSETKPAGDSEDALSKLERLADLQDRNAISEEEFKKKKRELMGEI